MRRARARNALSIALITIGSPLLAQGYVGGYARDATSGAPLPCIDVALEDTLGRVVAKGMTRRDGLFQFDAPDSGLYRLRFNVWDHDPVLAPPEVMTPSTERAREYRVGFGPPLPQSIWPPQTAPDGPIGPPRDRAKGSLAYPEELRRQRIEGDVRATYLVDSLGFVDSTTLHVTQSTHQEFADAVVTFLRGAQFTPPRRDHKPVCALMLDFPFTFRIGPDRILR